MTCAASLLEIPSLPPSSLPSQVFIALEDLAQTFSPPVWGSPVPPLQQREPRPIPHRRRCAALSSLIEVIKGRNLGLLFLLFGSGV